ncbi:hypothetical protein IE53DRAFT_412862 [Violaceomyces palustris]|uniref:Uncharacterized protein n=1 Tax=Violaceomyces palustris TaxID=1673888 RepID=A0ACD0NPH7_9BASI|nr:hypothetical protein IE53DRAFT_412862 [Violaceomyces palustris]
MNQRMLKQPKKYSSATISRPTLLSTIPSQSPPPPSANSSAFSNIILNTTTNHLLLSRQATRDPEDRQDLEEEDPFNSSYVRSYNLLRFFHILALLPTFLLLLLSYHLTYLSSYHCSIHLPRERGGEQVECRSILTRTTVISIILVGLTTWSTSYSLRKSWGWNLSLRLVQLLGILSSSISYLLFSLLATVRSSRRRLRSGGQGASRIRDERYHDDEGEEGSEARTDSDPNEIFETVGILSIFVRTALLELLRLFSIHLSICVLLSFILGDKRGGSEGISEGDELNLNALSTRHGQRQDLPGWAWRSDVKDPRFLTSILLACTWSSLDFLAGSNQVLHQVSLYSPERGYFGGVHESRGSRGMEEDRSSCEDWEEEEGEEVGDRLEDGIVGNGKGWPKRTRMGVVVGEGGSLEEEEEEQEEEVMRSEGVRKGEEDEENDDEEDRAISRSKASHVLRLARKGLFESRKAEAGGGDAKVEQEETLEPKSVVGHSRLARESFLDRRKGKPSGGGDQEEGQESSNPPPSSSSFPSTEEEEGRKGFSRTSTDLEMALEVRVHELLLAKERREVEEILGSPLPSIPVVLFSLWRLDGLLWSSATFLVLSSNLVHLEDGKDSKEMWITLSIVILLHSLNNLIWLKGLRSLGFACLTYSSLLLGLLLFLVGLARWGLLV